MREKLMPGTPGATGEIQLSTMLIRLPECGSSPPKSHARRHAAEPNEKPAPIRGRVNVRIVAYGGHVNSGLVVRLNESPRLDVAGPFANRWGGPHCSPNLSPTLRPQELACVFSLEFKLGRRGRRLATGRYLFAFVRFVVEFWLRRVVAVA